MTYSLWPGRDTVIFLIRFTFYLSRLMRNDLRMLADFFRSLMESVTGVDDARPTRGLIDRHQP